jgi:hypothetical protein
MNVPEPAPVPLSWRRHLAALFVTFHIVCVLIYVLPRPPALDDDVLDMPEVKVELDASVGAVNRQLHLRETDDDLVRDLFGLVRAYVEATNYARRYVTPYLELIDCTQSWNMFGGTPPRFPLVLMVDVKPAGEKDFVAYQDLSWGTPGSRALNFRHRKVHENLYFWRGWQDWDDYAAWWARRWDEQHPERPAGAVRLWFLRLKTPSAQQVRAGQSDRQPTTDDKERVWERP